MAPPWQSAKNADVDSVRADEPWCKSSVFGVEPLVTHRKKGVKTNILTWRLSVLEDILWHPCSNSSGLQIFAFGILLSGGWYASLIYQKPTDLQDVSLLGLTAEELRASFIETWP